ncbi:MAG: hypothetical protein EAZ20_06385, partial [Bacteroidetes bacterium]
SENEVIFDIKNEEKSENISENEVIFDIKNEEKFENISENEVIFDIKNEEKSENIFENEVIFDIKNEEKSENISEKPDVKFHILSEEEKTEEINKQFISPMTVVFEENKPKNNLQSTEKENENSFFDTFNQTLDIDLTPKTITKVFPEISEKKDIKLEIIEDEKIENWTENQAIFYFQEGKNEQSIQVYQRLSEENPAKKEYFEKQIKAISSQKMQDLKEKIENNIIQFSPHTTNKEQYSEELALRLFAQGRVSESIFVYEKLSELYPQKNNYYLSQISIMTS